MKPLKRLAALLTLTCAVASASAADLVVYCAGAVRPAMSALLPAWSARGGAPLHVHYYSAVEMTAKLAAGERPDVVIMPAETLDAAEKNHRVARGSRRVLGTVGIGVAVRSGAARPDLATEEGVKQALTEARSVTYMDPTRGTSGRYFDEVVLPRLGIRDAVRAKTLFGQGGMVAEKVATGEADIAVQQMTELLPVPGIDVVGPLPPSLQKTTVYAGAVTSATRRPNEAAGLLDFLSSVGSRATFASKGFAPP